MAGSVSPRLRHYFGLHDAESKFLRLVHDFHAQPLIRVIGELNSESSDTPRRSLEEICSADLGVYLGG
jgi:hypothetical protein